MGDMIDRDAVLALFNDWLLYAPSGHSVTYEICEAIRAIPAADARAEALREAAHVAWSLEDGDRWTRAAAQSAILALIPEKQQ